MEILLFCFILMPIICLFLVKRKKPAESIVSTVEPVPVQPVQAPETEINETPASEPEADVDYSRSYQPKYLLSRNEWYEYKKLKKLAAEKDMQVCPKVRMLDLVEPRKGAEHYKSLFYKIQAKHLDFLICDQDLHIKAVVELDDNSHHKADRQERDKFVDQVLTSCGYKVIRTRAVTEHTLDGI